MTVYGRLDVYWPDGKFDSYVLDKSVVSVGRAEGNTVMLDTEMLSRYHFSINRDENQVVTITDLGSSNGTFIDGIALPPNQPRVLETVEEIQVGQLRIIFQPGDDSPTMPTPTISEETARIERPDCRLELDMKHLDVWPASSSSAELAITNIALEPKRYTILITGMSEKWIRVNRPELEVYPGETAHVLVNVKPPRHPEIVPMSYNVTLHVAPADKPEAVIDMPLQVTIHGYSGLGVALAARQLEAGENMRLYLHNQGNEPLTVTLHGVDQAGTLKFNLPAAPVMLNAGQRLQVTGTISPKSRPIIGAPHEQEFHIHIKAQNPSEFLAVVAGKIVVRPLLPAWGAISMAGIIISLVIVAALFLTGIVNPPLPVIQDFQVSPEKVAQGETLSVTWQTENAATLLLYVNNAPVHQSASNNSRFEIPTANLTGEVAIELKAENRGRIATQTQTVYVYHPMTIETFTVTPDTLVSNVVSTLSITWKVPGAVTVRISGLEETDFAKSPQLSETYPAAGTLEVNGIAAGALAITLDAADEMGHTQQKVIIVGLIEAQCTAKENLSLREGPEERYQTVGSVKAGETVVVDRQAGAAAAWLRVVLPGDVNGWAPSALLKCADSFNPQLLQQEVNFPPLVLPSLTPTLAPTVMAATATRLPPPTLPPPPAPTQPPPPTPTRRP